MRAGSKGKSGKMRGPGTSSAEPLTFPSEEVEREAVPGDQVAQFEGAGLEEGEEVS